MSVNLQQLFQDYEREDAITVVEPGVYTLEVVRVSVKPGKPETGPSITPIFKAVEGPYTGKTIMAGGFTASEKARSIFFRQLAGFGLDKAYWESIGYDLKTAANALIGRVVKVNLITDKWNGEDRNKITIGGISLVAMPDPLAAAAPAPAPVAAPAAPAVPQPTAEATVPAAPPVPDAATGPAPF